MLDKQKNQLKFKEKDFLVPCIIGSHVTIKGNINTTGEIIIDGNIEGNIEADAIVVGKSSIIIGDITVNKITIFGKVEGTIKANCVKLKETAFVNGDVFNKEITIENGAFISGLIKMKTSNESLNKAKTQT